MRTKELTKTETTLRQQLNSLGAALESRRCVLVERSPDSSDEAQAEVIESCGIDTRNVTWQLRRQVLAALQRIKSGDYGVCEWCGEPIAAKRIEAVPWATRCVACQAQAEAEEWDQAA